MFTAVCSIVLSSGTYAASIKEQYELQERCGKRADEVFRREYGNGIGNDQMAGYTNHYNEKLNKCFVLVTVSIYKPDISNTMVLFDINENKEYGSIVTIITHAKDAPLTYCKVLERVCHSQKEWETLTRPFMEE